MYTKKKTIERNDLMPNKLNDRSKFFTINIKNVNTLIDNLGDDNKYNVNHKDLLALLYILKDIEFNTNLITISESSKKHIKTKIGMSDSSYNHFITKMRKLEIFSDKLKNDVYTVNKEYINFGNNEYESGEYIKVSSIGLEQDLEKSEYTLSSTEIKIFLYLLNSIRYNKGNFTSNTVVFDKKVKEEIINKFQITSRTLDNFIKKMKDTRLLIKINNSIFKVNDKYISFGGKLDDTPLPPVREKRVDTTSDEKSSIPESRKWLFKKGDDKNDK